MVVQKASEIPACRTLLLFQCAGPHAAGKVGDQAQLCLDLCLSRALDEPVLSITRL